MGCGVGKHCISEHYKSLAITVLELGCCEDIKKIWLALSINEWVKKVFVEQSDYTGSFNTVLLSDKQLWTLAFILCFFKKFKDNIGPALFQDFIYIYCRCIKALGKSALHFLKNYRFDFLNPFWHFWLRKISVCKRLCTFDQQKLWIKKCLAHV